MHNRVKIAKSLKTIRFQDLKETGQVVTDKGITKIYEFERDDMAYDLYATKKFTPKLMDIPAPKKLKDCWIGPQDPDCPIIPPEDIDEFDDGNGDDWADTEEDDEDDCHPIPPGPGDPWEEDADCNPINPDVQRYDC